MSQQQLTIKTPSVARLWFVLGVLGVMLLLLAFRAFDLHVLQHEFLANQGEKRNLRSEPLAAHRGVIYDRTGSPLAVSTPVTTLWGNPSELVEHRQEWQRLRQDRKSTRLNSSHVVISYAVLCLKKKTNNRQE